MAVIQVVKRAPNIIKKGVDKIFKRTIKGAEGSPYKEVDDLGSFPVARGINETVGTERKKLKAIGEKIKKANTKKRNEASKKIFDQSGRIRGGLRMGGRASYKSGTRGCKLAVKGKGRAYGKNS
tara:strand:+ start:346 stop:717 length:372 start_codon:yes stop_codon:yes gene_type:complete